MKQPSLIEHSQEEYTSIIEDINYKSETRRIVNIASAIVVIVAIIVIFKQNTEINVWKGRVSGLEKANDSLKIMKGDDLTQHTSY
jgi:hypothetical protein